MKTIKYCGVCLKYKERKQFNKKKMSGDGLQSHCRSCQKMYRDRPPLVSEVKFIKKQITNSELNTVIKYDKNIVNTNFRLKVYLSYKYVAGMNPFAISYIKKEFVSELEYNKWFEYWKNKFQSEDYICVELDLKLLKNY